jgi:hypothetical protein
VSIFSKRVIHPSIMMNPTMEQTNTGVLLEIHRSMVELWHRGYQLPIKWTLASFGSSAAVVSGATAENADTEELATTTSDGADLSPSFPLPAYLVATDATGLSVTGLMPWVPDQDQTAHDAA